MDVHVISLERTPGRLRKFRDANDHLSNTVLFPAVNGEAISRAKLSQLGVFSADAPAYSDGAIGCALSHLSLWKQATEHGPLTIAEDDALFNRGFEKKAEVLLHGLPADWDIVLWGWNFDSILLFDFLPGVGPCLGAFSEPQLQAQTRNYQRLEFTPSAYRLLKAFGTLAYSVSAAGAVKLANHCLPIRTMDVFCPGLNRTIANRGIDVMMNALYPQVNAYVSFPPLAVSCNEKTVSTVNQPSVVQQCDRGGQRRES